MLMLRGLLAERFELQTHTETRKLSYYALVMATAGGTLGDGIRPSTTDCAAYYARRNRSSPLRTLPSERHCGVQSRLEFGLTTMLLGAVEMTEFAKYLQPFVGQMVVDETGIIGRFDLEVTFKEDPTIRTPHGFGTAASDAPSLFFALQDELGLKLESRLGPIEVLVVDHVEQPTPN